MSIAHRPLTPFFHQQTITSIERFMQRQCANARCTTRPTRVYRILLFSTQAIGAELSGQQICLN
jgi:hypothetical protein